MGKLEEKTRQNIRKSKINSAIIGTIGLVGVLAVGALAPNILGAVGKSKYFRQRKYQLKSSLSRLISAGYIVVVEREDKKQLQLTKKGEYFAARIQAGTIVPKRSRWDKKWRILIFDIPEKRRSVRTLVRQALQDFGFVRLQDSVWVYPYDCEDLITILKVDLKVGKSLLYIIADTIEYDQPLRRHFGLPQA